MEEKTWGATHTVQESIGGPAEVAMGLVGHNIKEFTHLNKILPSVYAEEKDNW